jgi:hypothetical protein
MCEMGFALTPPGLERLLLGRAHLESVHCGEHSVFPAIVVWSRSIPRSFVSGIISVEAEGIATFRPLAAADQFRKAYQNASGASAPSASRRCSTDRLRRHLAPAAAGAAGAARMSGRRSSIARMTACRSAISGFISAVPPLNG